MTPAVTVGRMASRKPVDAVERAVERVAGIVDPERRVIAAQDLLEALTAARDAVSVVRHEAAAELHHENGMTHAELAELLGVSKPRAQQVIHGVSRWTTGRERRED